MASGKYVKVQKGVLSLGYSTPEYASAKAYSAYRNSATRYGFNDSVTQFISLTTKYLYIGKDRGYTGTLKAYTDFYCPYGVLVWSPSEVNPSSVSMTYRYLHFDCGILTGWTYGGTERGS